jgi:hypothetical protein
MKRASYFALFVLLSVLAVEAQPKAQPPIPQIMAHARYVYVTSWDGPQFSPNPLPEDRAAITDVQNALQSWGHYAVVYEPRLADLIIVVQRRGSEDYLAVYDPRFDNNTPLWWTSARGGLDPHEMPLVKSLESVVDQASLHKGPGSGK